MTVSNVGSVYPTRCLPNWLPTESSIRLDSCDELTREMCHSSDPPLANVIWVSLGWKHCSVRHFFSPSCLLTVMHVAKNVICKCHTTLILYNLRERARKNICWSRWLSSYWWTYHDTSTNGGHVCYNPSVELSPKPTNPWGFPHRLDQITV